MKFDENELQRLGYRWNSHKDYMFKSSDFMKASNGKIFCSCVFVYPNGDIEVDTPSNLSDKMVEELILCTE